MVVRKKNIRIMKFNELKGEGDVLNKLYTLKNKEITGLVNDLIHGGEYHHKKDIVEEILLVLDDIKGITPEEYHEVEDELNKYIK